MGQPDTVAHSPGEECAYYSLLKDFWKSVPWSMSERYYVCYDEGKVATFGSYDGDGLGDNARRAGVRHSTRPILSGP